MHVVEVKVDDALQADKEKVVDMHQLFHRCLNRFVHTTMRELVNVLMQDSPLENWRSSILSQSLQDLNQPRA